MGGACGVAKQGPRATTDVDRVDAASTYAAAMAGGRTAHGMTVMGVDVVSMWSPAAASCVIAETHRNLASEYCALRTDCLSS